MRPDPQLVRLVRLLNELSTRGKLDWVKTADDSGFRVVLNGGLVRIQHANFSLRGGVERPESFPIYSISVRDRNGGLVLGGEEEFTRDLFPELADLHYLVSDNLQERSIQILMDELNSKLAEK